MVAGSKPHIVVAAGAIWGPDDLLLISRRPETSHLAGYWELPGGKLESGETAADALVREIEEEMAVTVEAGPEFSRVTHDYPDKIVTLIGLHARYVSGEPQCIGVAETRWVRPSELHNFAFPPANARLFTPGWAVQPAWKE
ncbi:8-oxo-dGTP diphosphatase MutT [bacterium]|nr:8-oxo-dGTP diphosphatase MutT [bacterium]